MLLEEAKLNSMAWGVRGRHQRQEEAHGLKALQTATHSARVLPTLREIIVSARAGCTDKMPSEERLKNNGNASFPVHRPGGRPRARHQQVHAGLRICFLVPLDAGGHGLRGQNSGVRT